VRATAGKTVLAKLSPISMKGVFSGKPSRTEDEANSFTSARALVSFSSPMQSVSNDTFGPLIAYLLPGATALFGFSPFAPTLRSWFATAPTDSPTIGGFLYLTVAALAVGMTVSAIRWAVVDTLHGRLGLKPPKLDFSKLGKNVEAYTLLIEIHYRHYQFYANMFIATAIAYICYRVRLGELLPLGPIDVAFVGLEAVFFATSRDTLQKYHVRCSQLLKGGTPTKR
jgi:hypothetical protein